MTKGTPQPTDICKICEEAYIEHSPIGRLCPERNEPFFAYSRDRKFTPIVPSPDSVKDMGEVLWLKKSPDHTRPYNYRLWLGESWVADLIVSTKYPNCEPLAELIAAAPATAARLEEALRENEELKKRILFFEGSGYLNYQKLVEQRDSLLKDVERYREALNRFKEFVVRAGASVDLEERKKLMDLFAALSRGATEQSTEQ